MTKEFLPALTHPGRGLNASEQKGCDTLNPKRAEPRRCGAQLGSDRILKGRNFLFAAPIALKLG
jgi:hypothetical protein